MYRSISYDVSSCLNDLNDTIGELESAINEEHLENLKDIADDLDGIYSSSLELEDDLEQSDEEVEHINVELSEIKEEMHSLFSKLMDRMTEMEKVDMYRITKDLQDVLDGTSER